ncbi:hypothetical protein GEV33_008335 [Tenebrio molitor]|uniref:Uncharacterized protein n=1 Tax=Tenebrio molitor TaxID=7067 RepID=A0A8J6HGV2_TENMO|nr:hypothetical protein GEV33_008335 [Tenebrio molitor]
MLEKCLQSQSISKNIIFPLLVSEGFIIDSRTDPRSVSVVAAATRYGWSASQDLERVWSEADILAAEPGRKHVSVSSRADTSTWFPVGKRPHECIFASTGTAEQRSKAEAGRIRPRATKACSSENFDSWSSHPSHPESRSQDDKRKLLGRALAKESGRPEEYFLFLHDAEYDHDTEVQAVDDTIESIRGVLSEFEGTADDSVFKRLRTRTPSRKTRLTRRVFCSRRNFTKHNPVTVETPAVVATTPILTQTRPVESKLVPVYTWGVTFNGEDGGIIDGTTAKKSRIVETILRVGARVGIRASERSCKDKSTRQRRERFVQKFRQTQRVREHIHQNIPVLELPTTQPLVCELQGKKEAICFETFESFIIENEVQPDINVGLQFPLI